MKIFIFIFILLTLSGVITSCSSGACEIENNSGYYSCHQDIAPVDCNVKNFTYELYSISAKRVHYHDGKSCSSIGYALELSAGSEIFYADEELGVSPTGYFGGGNSGDVRYFDYTFTCVDINQTNTITIPYKSATCLEAKKFMTKTFTCNEVQNMELSQQRCINECSAGREDCSEL